MPESNNDLYQRKMNRIEDAVQLKKPDRIPVILEFGYFVARYAGITYQDLIYDRAKCTAAYRKAVIDFEPDAFHCIPFDSGPAMEAIDSLTVKWPGHGVGCNRSHQYVEGEFMLADEYDAFLEDPTGFLLRSYLPRICGTLSSFREFPDMLSLMGPARGIISPIVAAPEFVNACQAVYRTARAGIEWNAVWRDFVKTIESAGNPAITHPVCLTFSKFRRVKLFAGLTVPIFTQLKKFWADTIASPVACCLHCCRPAVLSRLEMNV